MARFNNSLLLIVFLVFVFFAVSVNAEIPGLMNYQGRLTDDTGNPVADIPHSLIFKIYDEDGAVLWEESHLVTTAEGFFTVQLGSNGSPLTADIFNHAECWLGITVGTDPEISPRTRLNTVPYAFKTGNVESGDIINEPGVAAFSGAYYVYLTDLAYTVLCSLTVACPAEGYVMAVAHGRIATLPQHTTGINSYAIVGISDNSTSLPGNQDLDFQIPVAALSGVYSIPFGMTSMFEVPSAGSYTYYYLAYEYSGSISVADMQFNLVYFPTAYGTVDPVPPPVKAPDGDGIARLDGLTRIESESKQTEFGTSDIVELKRELEVMKTRLEAMQQQIDSCNSR